MYSSLPASDTNFSEQGSFLDSENDFMNTDRGDGMGRGTVIPAYRPRPILGPQTRKKSSRGLSEDPLVDVLRSEDMLFTRVLMYSGNIRTTLYSVGAVESVHLIDHSLTDGDSGGFSARSMDIRRRLNDCANSVRRIDDLFQLARKYHIALPTARDEISAQAGLLRTTQLAASSSISSSSGSRSGSASSSSASRNATNTHSQLHGDGEGDEDEDGEGDGDGEYEQIAHLGTDCVDDDIASFASSCISGDIFSSSSSHLRSVEDDVTRHQSVVDQASQDLRYYIEHMYCLALASTICLDSNKYFTIFDQQHYPRQRYFSSSSSSSSSTSSTSLSSDNDTLSSHYPIGTAGMSDTVGLVRTGDDEHDEDQDDDDDDDNDEDEDEDELENLLVFSPKQKTPLKTLATFGTVKNSLIPVFKALLHTSHILYPTSSRLHQEALSKGKVKGKGKSHSSSSSSSSSSSAAASAAAAADRFQQRIFPSSAFSMDEILSSYTDNSLDTIKQCLYDSEKVSKQMASLSTADSIALSRTQAERLEKLRNLSSQAGDVDDGHLDDSELGYGLSSFYGRSDSGDAEDRRRKRAADDSQFSIELVTIYCVCPENDKSTLDRMVSRLTRGNHIMHSGTMPSSKSLIHLLNTTDGAGPGPMGDINSYSQDGAEIMAGGDAYASDSSFSSSTDSESSDGAKKAVICYVLPPGKGLAERVYRLCRSFNAQVYAVPSSLPAIECLFSLVLDQVSTKEQLILMTASTLKQLLYSTVWGLVPELESLSPRMLSNLLAYHSSFREGVQGKSGKRKKSSRGWPFSRKPRSQPSTSGQQSHGRDYDVIELGIGSSGTGTQSQPQSLQLIDHSYLTPKMRQRVMEWLLRSPPQPQVSYEISTGLSGTGASAGVGSSPSPSITSAGFQRQGEKHHKELHYENSSLCQRFHTPPSPLLLLRLGLQQEMKFLKALNCCRQVPNSSAIVLEGWVPVSKAPHFYRSVIGTGFDIESDLDLDGHGHGKSSHPSQNRKVKPVKTHTAYARVVSETQAQAKIKANSQSRQLPSRLPLGLSSNSADFDIHGGMASIPPSVSIITTYALELDEDVQTSSSSTSTSTSTSTTSSSSSPSQHPFPTLEVQATVPSNVLGSISTLRAFMEHERSVYIAKMEEKKQRTRDTARILSHQDVDGISGVPGLLSPSASISPLKSKKESPKSLSVPPTSFFTNDFLAPFQSIVNTYGIPNYGEVNPGLFTSITFPFLFGMMYGDVFHGGCIAVFGLVLCLLHYFGPIHWRWSNSPMSMILSVRYMVLLMGLFAFYCGFIYNDFASIPLALFPSRFNEKNPSSKEYLNNPVYPFGMDYMIYHSIGELAFFNSFKMKLSIVTGVLHMTFGILLGAVNHVHFNHKAALVLETLPRLLLLLATFGYMVFIIIYKWTVDWTQSSTSPPNLIQTMIQMFLAPGVVKPSEELFPHQATVQVLLLLIAACTIPVLFVAEPLYRRQQHRLNFPIKYRTQRLGSSPKPTQKSYTSFEDAESAQHLTSTQSLGAGVGGAGVGSTSASASAGRTGLNATLELDGLDNLDGLDSMEDGNGMGLAAESPSSVRALGAALGLLSNTASENRSTFFDGDGDDEDQDQLQNSKSKPTQPLLPGKPVNNSTAGTGGLNLTTSGSSISAISGFPGQTDDQAGKTRASPFADSKPPSIEAHELTDPSSEHYSFSDDLIHQGIHSIEFILGTVSNTASYLRLWALSLAHAQLAQVFWSKMLLDYGLQVGPFATFIGYSVWAGATFGVLLCMDTLECFLHALRLHWVEFQNKFYVGTGYLYEPFTLRGSTFVTGIGPYDKLE